MANPIVQLFRKSRAAPDEPRRGDLQPRHVTGLMTRFRSAYRGAIRDALEMPDGAAADASRRSDRAS
jgi:hypothetical protein